MQEQEKQLKDGLRGFFSQNPFATPVSAYAIEAPLISQELKKQSKIREMKICRWLPVLKAFLNKVDHWQGLKALTFFLNQIPEDTALTIVECMKDLTEIVQ